MIRSTQKFSGSGDSAVYGYIDNLIQYLSIFKNRDHMIVEALANLGDLQYMTTQEVDLYVYNLSNNTTWYVLDTEEFKFVTSKNYHMYFNKLTGETFRFGATPDEDPSMCDLGPEILDLEISVNGCPTVNGHNCRFCYKNNTNAEPVNMTLETFEQIVSKFPKNLCQIAFGITGALTNPDFPKILDVCRRKYGIIPNYTLSGADIKFDGNKNEYPLLSSTCRNCGAIAVSCYEGAKDLCYKIIFGFWSTSIMKLHINMHIVLSRGTMNHVMDVLNDIANHKVTGLRSIVFLRIKPVGRAKFLDTDLTTEEFEKVISFCKEHDISYGFDSCSAHNVIETFKKMGDAGYIQYCEPCESSKFSSYINVNGEYWHCSFCERNEQYKPIKVLECQTINDFWLSKEIEDFRNPKNRASVSCQAFALDLK